MSIVVNGAILYTDNAHIQLQIWSLSKLSQPNQILGPSEVQKYSAENAGPDQVSIRPVGL